MRFILSLVKFVSGSVLVLAGFVTKYRWSKNSVTLGFIHSAIYGSRLYCNLPENITRINPKELTYVSMTDFKMADGHVGTFTVCPYMTISKNNSEFRLVKFRFVNTFDTFGQIHYGYQHLFGCQPFETDFSMELNNYTFCKNNPRLAPFYTNEQAISEDKLENPNLYDLSYCRLNRHLEDIFRPCIRKHFKFDKTDIGKILLAPIFLQKYEGVVFSKVKGDERMQPGLNIDERGFVPYGLGLVGGFCFVHNHDDTDIVTIPHDAEIYIEGDRAWSDKIILNMV